MIGCWGEGKYLCNAAVNEQCRSRVAERLVIGPVAVLK